MIIIDNKKKINKKEKKKKNENGKKKIEKYAMEILVFQLKIAVIEGVKEIKYNFEMRVVFFISMI